MILSNSALFSAMDDGRIVIIPEPAPLRSGSNIYICQLIVEEVQGQPLRNDSQFQGQSRPGGG